MPKPYHSIKSKKARVKRLGKMRGTVKGIKGTYKSFLHVLSKLPPKGITALQRELKKLTPKIQRDLRESLRRDRRRAIILSSPEMKRLKKSLTERERWMVNCSFLDNALVRMHAVKDLAETRKKKFVPVFEAKLKDPLWTVRCTALDALGHLKSKSSIPLIIPKLYDASPDVRITAMSNLYGLGFKGAVPRIKKLLEKEKNRGARKYAKQILAAFSKQEK